MKVFRYWNYINFKIFNLPPATSPFVLIADMEVVVITHTTAEMAMIRRVCPIPDCATTQDNRRKSITPQMLSKHGISTPWIHPNFTPCPPDLFAGVVTFSFKSCRGKKN